MRLQSIYFVIQDFYFHAHSRTPHSQKGNLRYILQPLRVVFADDMWNHVHQLAYVGTCVHRTEVVQGFGGSNDQFGHTETPR